MKFRPIRWQLSLSYAAIAFLATTLLGIIMLGILRQYYTEQEHNYLTMNAEETGSTMAGIAAIGISETEQKQFLEIIAFMSNTQVRLLDENRQVVEDTGPPERRATLMLDAFAEDSTQVEASTFAFPSTSDPLTEYTSEPYSDAEAIYVDVSDSGLFPEFGLGYAGMVNETDMATIDAAIDAPRSGQVITIPYYDNVGNLLGYVELSNGPAYGSEILRSVAWGWAIAALAAIFLAAAAGIWVSRRFSAPLEILTHTTTQMAGGNLAARTDIQRPDEFGLLAASFNQMADSIEAKVIALRRFVADAAHELVTPLTALRTNLELLDAEQSSPALEQVERMDALSRSLLDLSRLEAASDEMQYEEVDLAPLLQGLAEPFASRADQGELSFDLEIEVNPAKIEGDAAQLQTLISNLLDNAIKFTPAGGQVSVHLQEQDNAVQLTITDTGIGIPEDDQIHLFSRFHRGRNASAYPGSGLGLAIVKAIADQHGASITVESGPSGTKFVVVISRD